MSTATELAERCESLASIADAYSEEAYRDAAAELRRLDRVNAELVEALKSTGLLLHHLWCDAQLNEYSFEKLNKQIAVVDAALTSATKETT